MKDKKIPIFIVEDQPKILKNLVKLLSGSDAVQITGQALSGEDAIKQLESSGAEVVLLDLGMPGMDGIETTKQIKKRWPSKEVLIFTIFDEENKVLEAIQAGASGYLLKGMEAEKIIEAIKDVHEGGSVIQPSLARSLLRHFKEQKQPSGEPNPGLTPREVEILQIIAKGLSNAEAAKVLGISRATIRTHLEHIYTKLSVTNRVEAITEGIRQGLIDV
ncbi:MAG: DNA-binding response regulator [Deltaproteobacteria bacterium]|nr:MAG: DNA-binding response regulator [Deltaproteobacteria bacterium]